MSLTRPALPTWPPSTPPGTSPARDGYRRAEVCAVVGHGEAAWAHAQASVLRWGVKTASGFSVPSTAEVVPGERVLVTAHVAGLRIVEPVQVLDVVREPARVGFAYATLPGHPVAGEEAFIVHRAGDTVYLTVRSLTRPAATQPWRALFPLLLVAQRFVRRRYLRALRR